MKKLILRSSLLVSLAFPFLASAAEGLETDDQKFSYALGLQIAQSLIRQGVSIDPEAFAKAVGDVVTGRDPRLSPDELQLVMETHEKKATDNLRERAKRNLVAGREFREQNQQQDGVQTLESGLQYKIIKQGGGKRPAQSDTVLVHYTGTLIDGREFDSSHRRGEPTELALNGVIPGWQEALQLMPAGSRWQIVIPPDLAYGARGAGAVIGPNETLLFDLELLSIVGK